jgi:hypothetical protein
MISDIYCGYMFRQVKSNFKVPIIPRTFFLDCLILEYLTDWSSWNVGKNYERTLRNNPESQRRPLHRDESLKSRIAILKTIPGTLYLKCINYYIIINI